ncbi:alanine racemase [Bombilactobacillus thymidiniphilus]|uniref:Alanine racemase n=1 Tax=Bombilactobacillus thymidiniphilus TaxID=2923363 RepID=A0ABY4PE28_9LACO|nr:alanine racemase [Bombilactobacillus thymidiniphilus]UQS84033.1 alanine racemase [Bombilactobacillus thymidiniphilus]
MQPAIHRPTRAIIDRQAIRNNFLHERQQLTSDKYIFAVVKANAYGHGAVAVAKVLHELQVDGFCVATLDEALELRQNGLQEPILVLGITSVQDVQLAAENDISLTAASLAWLEEAVNNLQQPLKIHLAIDSGMNRLGIRDRLEVIAATEFLLQETNLVAEGIFTHFATADEPDVTYFNSQERKFRELICDVRTTFQYVHCANSATALWHQDVTSNVIRLGISLYGLNPSGTVMKELPYSLHPALSLTSEVSYIKQLPAGQKVGYGATYTTSSDEIIATIPIGYADGWLRRLSGSKIIIDDELCPIVGRICMDQLMVSVGHMVPVGTPVVLIGTQADLSISATDVANYSKTINYEITCNLSDRIPRTYIN